MTTIIDIKNLETKLGGQAIHKNLNLTVNQREILGIVGGSGSGKTTLLRAILMLLRPTAGSIKVFGTEITQCTEQQASAVRHRWGMLFQQNALFSSLNVLENVQFPLVNFTQLPVTVQEQIALLKIALVGLPDTAAIKYPAELSGGMQKRAGLARAIALDPELLFLDEPTAGLDPQSAEALDELVLHLRDNLDLTVVIVTHDLDTLWRISDRVAFLGEGNVLSAAPLAKLMEDSHPSIQAYFKAYRGLREKTDGTTR